MRKPFTTYASSRFVDPEAVREALHACAERLLERRPEVEAVHLFGSFASGRATPRSDADILVEIEDRSASLQDDIRTEAAGLFLKAPVPVDLFVMTSAALAENRRQGRGIAGAVAREGVLLARAPFTGQAS
jgi:predicted nucleotidyltransferase